MVKLFKSRYWKIKMPDLNRKQSNTSANPLIKQQEEAFSSIGHDGSWPLWLCNFVDNYQKLSTDNLDLLDLIYHQDITFIDPIHQLSGFDNLKAYFIGLYQNLSACEFIIDDVIYSDDKAAIYWTMIYKHSKLNSGNAVTVFGNSHIKGLEDKVIYHRDYLDAGAMLYEQIPLLGKVVKFIKRKATS